MISEAVLARVVNPLGDPDGLIALCQGLVRLDLNWLKMLLRHRRKNLLGAATFLHHLKLVVMRITGSRPLQFDDLVLRTRWHKLLSAITELESFTRLGHHLLLVAAEDSSVTKHKIVASSVRWSASDSIHTSRRTSLARVVTCGRRRFESSW